MLDDGGSQRFAACCEVSFGLRGGARPWPPANTRYYHAAKLVGVFVFAQICSLVATQCTTDLLPSSSAILLIVLTPAFSPPRGV